MNNITKNELFDIFDKYDTYEFIKEGGINTLYKVG